MNETQLKEIRDPSTKKQVLAVSTGSKHGSLRAQPDGPQFNCSKCFLKHGPRQCPAFGKTCFVCDGRNHFAKMCILCTRKVFIVSRSSALADSWARNARSDRLMDTERLLLLFVIGVRD